MAQAQRYHLKQCNLDYQLLFGPVLINQTQETRENQSKNYYYRFECTLKDTLTAKSSGVSS